MYSCNKPGALKLNRLQMPVVRLEICDSKMVIIRIDNIF